jgi:hypothetical protein
MKHAALALVAVLLAPMPVVRAADVTIVRSFSADKNGVDAPGVKLTESGVGLIDRSCLTADIRGGLIFSWE